MTTTEPVAATATAAGRVPPQPGEAIDRSQTFSITWDGKAYPAHPGDTLASALAAGGVRVFSRSFKYHRPRGLLCCAGQCPNCLVQVGEEPNVRACTRAAEPGLAVTHQNAWPSLDADLMSLTEMGDRFLPVGFYYKAFVHPRLLWPAYEGFLRRAAGLGVLNPAALPPEHADVAKQFRFAEVVVVGGGPAGMSAALAAAERGAKVLLCDENPRLGGHLRYSRDPGPLADLRSAVLAHANISVLTECAVTGWYEDNWLAAQQHGHLIKIRAQAMVVAAGAYEQPLVFDHNDVPGVMLAGAALRLLKLYGVLPGRRALIVTANDDGWEAAAALLEAGAEVAAIVDERKREDCASPLRETLSGKAPVFWQHTLAAAHGGNWVTGGRVARVDGANVQAAGGQSLACDLILLSVAWAPAAELAYQAGAKLTFDEARGELRAETLPPGVYLAGRAAGTHAEAAQAAEGRLAGREAAAFVALFLRGRENAESTAGALPLPPAGEGAQGDEEERAALAAQKAAEPARTSQRVVVPGDQKRIVCFCEDVTEKDIQTSVAEGFDSLELLKRYSTVSMGPCQGKMCSLNSTHLCARANGLSVAEAGLTTQRPPTTPLSLRALAGLPMEPVQVSPLHEWHVAHGARLTVAGQWLRAERYGDPALEVRAVRQAVGVIDVGTLGKLRLTGPGVPALLDRLYINQFAKLPVGRVRYGVMCNDEGVVLDDGVCAHVGPQEWYLTTTSSGAGAIFEWIQWWAQSGWGEGVHITDLTETYAAINLAGPQSRAVLAQVTALDVTNAAFPYMHLREAEVAGVPCRLLRIGFTGELSYEIHVPAGYTQHVWDALLEAGKPLGILPFGLEAQRVLRLEKGHIIVSQDTDAATDPLSADLGWAVKLDKPDFLGRRSLVRIAHDGPKDKLVGFKMAQPNLTPEEGLQIVRQEPEGKLTIIGWVTSARYSPTLQQSIGLCWLPAELAEQPEAPFTIRLLNGAGLAEAHVHHGPFYDPDGTRLRM